MKRLAIFASGSGTNLENILRAVKRGLLRAEIAFCFSDNPKAAALKRARRMGVSTVMFSPKQFSSRKEYERELIHHLRREEVDYVILAGYMRLVGKEFVKKFRNRILNIHPALLPSFKGTRGIKDAYDYGVKVTGVTVHFVDECLDAGPIILQEAISLRCGESRAALEKRIHKLEYKLYPKAINLLIKGRLRVKGRKVIVKH